ncbi:MAG: tetraacyldisaccharide 4'-kinase [Sulfuritalea sp.]|nr:tetraacyldisaccharide 4'-kinase [Sulfuritalea sp.]
MPPSRRSADTGGLTAVWRRRGPLACLLLPFALLFSVLAGLRRALYRAGFLHRERLPVAVVVVGNITVGGTGKTPLVIHLARALCALGRHPGIVSRGYRGDTAHVAEVTPGSDPGVVGDEPVLLARRSGCPVFVGRDRVAAARALLAGYPRCDVILADDGLQHYRLDRDVEIVMFDERGLMNGWPLPAGPLREPVSRLARVDAVVLNGTAITCPRSGIDGPQRGIPVMQSPGTQSAPAPALCVPSGTVGRPVFVMRLAGESFHRLDDPQIKCSAADFAGRKLHAVAAIGAPQRFFDRLSGMGLSFAGHPFADHHRFCAEDLAFAGDAILATEKDAVKLARLSLTLPVWVLPVTAEVSPDLAAFVLEKLNGHPSA